MKYFIKNNEPIAFTNWKAKANNDWRPSYDILAGDEKKAVIATLKQEQGYLCCYCERSIDNNECHIEHLRPQNLEDVDPLDFGNMACSCQKNLDRGEPRHCGNSKGPWYKVNLFISPLSPDCEDKFSYTHDGYIEPRIITDNAAVTTIEKLELRIDKLNALRNKAIEPFLDEDLTPEEISAFVNGYLIPKEDNNGRFNEFYTTIKHLFG